MLQNALEYAKLGYFVFPLAPNSKVPAIEDFPNQATRDPEKIKKWWLDPVLEIEQPFNVGISTSNYGEGEALVVVDIDNKEGLKGEEALLGLSYDLPHTANQVTPTGGRHLIYKHKEALKQGAHVLGECLDIRSRGGYIVGAGSSLKDGAYQGWLDVELQDCPKEVVEACGKAPEKKEDRKEIVKVDKKAAHDWAKYYLQIEAPEAVEGQGGDQTTFRVIANLKDHGILKEDCLDLLFENWFEGCGWTAEELQKKIDNAYRYGQEKVGSKSAEAVFEKVDAGEKLHPLRELNEKHALVFMQGNHFVLHETKDQDGQPVTHYLSEATFKRMYSHKTLQDGDKFKKLTNVWLDWEDRRSYAGAHFLPGKAGPANYYNTWRGFSVEEADPNATTAEQREGLKMFLEHIRENVAQGNEGYFNWIMTYFAHMIQRPWEKPRTAMAFRGGKGVGKNIMADIVGDLLGGDCYKSTSNARYLTSNFNGHLESNVLLVLDEAFWSGDKAAEGVLKNLVTENKLLIERKGKESYMANIFTRLIILGNEDWIVPSSQDERRFAVFEVGDGRKQDTEFFSKMRKLFTEKGAGELLLYYLRNFDINSADIDKIPSTKALAEQKEHSADIVTKWFKECLMEGEILGAEFVNGWPEDIPIKEVTNAVCKYAKEHNYRSRLPDARSIGRRLKNLLGRKRRVTIGASRPWVYKPFPLEEAREKYEEYIGHKIDWENE